MPEKTLNYFELFSDEKAYFPYRIELVRPCISIIKRMLYNTQLTQQDIKKCLKLLDIFAMAGWDEALEILDSIERPD